MMRTALRKTAETATSRTGRCRLRIIGVPFFCRRLQGSVLNPREPFREPGALSIGGPLPSTRARLTSSRNVTLTRLGHRLRLLARGALGRGTGGPIHSPYPILRAGFFAGRGRAARRRWSWGPNHWSTVTPTRPLFCLLGRRRPSTQYASSERRPRFGEHSFEFYERLGQDSV